MSPINHLYVETNSRLGLANFTIQLQEPDDFHSIKICKPNIIKILNKRCTSTSIQLIDDWIFPVEVKNLKLEGQSVRFAVVCKKLADISPENKIADASSPILDEVIALVKTSEAILCRFCSNMLADSSEITTGRQHLEGTKFYEPERFFCCSSQETTREPCEGEDKRLDPVEPPISTCLVSHCEILIRQSLLKGQALNTFKEAIVCARCYNVVGHVNALDVEKHKRLFLDRISVKYPELDIDGEIIRHLEAPLIQDQLNLTNSMLNHFLQDHCYRVVIHAFSLEGSTEFILLWLLDQRVKLQWSTWLEEITDEAPEKPIAADSINVNRVLFHTINIPDQQPSEASKKILNDWAKDFSVEHLFLPWDTCFFLATYLTEMSVKLAPQNRLLQEGPMAGFTVSGLPVNANSNK